MGVEGLWTDEAILEESALWVHVPANGIRVEDESRILVHLPQHWETSRVWRSSAADERQARSLIEQTINEVRTAGRKKLVWHTGACVAPAFMDGCLAEHGFKVTEELEVLAFELGNGSQPLLPRFNTPAGIRAECVLTAECLWAAHRVASKVFSKPAPSDGEISEFASELEKLKRRKQGEPQRDEPLTLMFMASVATEASTGHGDVIACAGEQIVNETVRLWGAGTLAEFRGQGAYKALVLERCRVAHALGATLALTKANVGTSGPILQRAGFRCIGTERRHVLEVL